MSTASSPVPTRFLALYLPRLPSDRIRRERLGRSWRSAARPEPVCPSSIAEPLLFQEAPGSAHRAGGALLSHIQGNRLGEKPPLVVYEKIEGSLRLVALCEAAEGLGLSRGMGLAEARARFPELDACENDPAAETNLLEGIADWCERWTPLVALDGADGLVLDISGCAHLFGGEAAMMGALVAQVTAQGFAVGVAVASHAGSARALVRHAPGTRLEPGREAEALAPLTVAALRLGSQTAALLSRLGLKRVGELIAMPRAGLTHRFGRELGDALDEALGLRSHPIAPRRPVPLIIHERRLFEPISQQDDVLSIVDTLTARIAQDLANRCEGARELELSLFRVDGAVERVVARLSAPSREPARLARMFKERLTAQVNELDAGFGYDLVKLSVLRTDAMSEVQSSLDEAQRNGEAVETLLDRLSARLGEVSVFGLEDLESHRPERTQTLRFGATGDAGAAFFSLSPRPLRLLAPPERVVATAEVPEGAPVQFRWRRALHKIARVEGPERIAPEWWRQEAAPSRDYWRVEDDKGRRYWLFREGHYGGEAKPDWYLHGLFA